MEETKAGFNFCSRKAAQKPGCIGYLWTENGSSIFQLYIYSVHLVIPSPHLGETALTSTPGTAVPHQGCFSLSSCLCPPHLCSKTLDTLAEPNPCPLISPEVEMEILAFSHQCCMNTSLLLLPQRQVTLLVFLPAAVTGDPPLPFFYPNLNRGKKFKQQRRLLWSKLCCNPGAASEQHRAKEQVRIFHVTGQELSGSAPLPSCPLVSSLPG